jgi:adenosylmethionine-8-amino-7-oxononanoate aminotransferase
LAGAELVGQIRTGVGALGAVAFAPEALAAHPDLPVRTFAHAKARGVLVRPLGDGVAISPPLVAEREEILEAGRAIGEAIAAVAEDLGSTAAAPAS